MLFRSDRKILLFVGRVSKEKNLAFLCDAFKTLCAERNDAVLLIVGDGPYREEMTQTLAGLPAVFAGLMFGDELVEAYASSDIFVFPSATDTFGNVVLEAQACGLPAIVTDKGGPMENIIPGKTGAITSANDERGLVRANRRLPDDPPLLDRMRLAAREYMENRSFEAAFEAQWALYFNSSATEPISEPLPDDAFFSIDAGQLIRRAAASAGVSV